MTSVAGIEPVAERKPLPTEGLPLVLKGDFRFAAEVYPLCAL